MSNLTIKEKGAEAKREYYRKYRQANRDKINRQAREWRKKNPDKVKEHNKSFWIRKADQLAE